MAEVCKLFGITKFKTSPYKPSTNQVERFHKTMNAILAKTVSKGQRDWDDQLPFVLAAYRATMHNSTGFTPNRLVLGKEVLAPIDGPLRTSDMREDVNCTISHIFDEGSVVFPLVFIVDTSILVYGITKLKTSPDKPSTNQVERYHKTMNAILAKTVSKGQRDWDDQLSFVLAAYRATMHNSTGFTPNRLVLGKEVLAPIDGPLRTSDLPEGVNCTISHIFDKGSVVFPLVFVVDTSILVSEVSTTKTSGKTGPPSGRSPAPAPGIPKDFDCCDLRLTVPGHPTSSLLAASDFARPDLLQRFSTP